MSTPSASPNNPHLQPPLKGSCHCTKATYTLTASPIRVNCCHCTDCHQKSGSAFLTNLIIERSNIQITSSTQPQLTEQSPGISIARCSTCYVALWSTIPSLGPDVAFIRAGTLERCMEVMPDVHFFTRTKVGWVGIPDGVRVYHGGKPDGEPGYWSEEGKRRIEVVTGRKMA